MYALDEVAAAAPAFREALRLRRGFRPLSIKLKIVDGCNLRCGMCNHWRRRRPNELSLERLEGLFDELVTLGCRKVHLTGGEPGLREDLEEIVAAGSRAGLRMTLTTNATLLTRQRARRLVEGGLRAAAVSIDSPVAEVHDRQRGLSGAFERAVSGLKNLRKEARRGKLGLAVNTVVTRLNWRTLGELPALAARLGARALRLMPVDGHTGAELRLDAAEIAAFNAELAPRLERDALRLGLLSDPADAWPFGRDGAETARAARGEYALGYYRERACFAPFSHALVDHDGRVFVCCMARGEASLGSVCGTPFAAVWDSAAYHDVRSAMLTPTRLPPCARCDDFIDENRRLQRILDLEREEAS